LKLNANEKVTAMSAKSDVQALRLISDEVVRLLSLPDEKLDAEAEVFD
jgi:hypothetical protein